MTAQNNYHSFGQPIVFAAAAAAWVHNTAYVTGIIVTNGGNSYFCVLSHTSTNDAGTGFATDLAAGKWLLVTAVTWTPQNEGTGKGRISAVCDRGSGNLPHSYEYRCSSRWVATVAAGDTLRLYLLTSQAAANAALTDGCLTFGDAELTAETNIAANARATLRGPIAATATDQQWESSGDCEIIGRYFGIAGWNSSATKALTNTASDHWFMLIPVPSTLEAAA